MSILDARITNPLQGGPSFPIGDRLFRALWNITWFSLASWTPPLMHGWRRFLLKLFGAKVGATSIIYGSARIWDPANFQIGERAWGLASLSIRWPRLRSAIMRLPPKAPTSARVHTTLRTRIFSLRRGRLKSERVPGSLQMPSSVLVSRLAKALYWALVVARSQISTLGQYT